MAKFTIRAKGFKPFEAEAGTKLVLALEAAGIDVSHRCGGQAKCTTCRCRIVGEEPPMGEVERTSLEEDGVLGQFRLSCQIRIDRDLDVEVLMRAGAQGWEAGPTPEP